MATQGGGLSETTFSLAPRGFATSFPEQDTPQEYSAEFRNLFTNSVGNGEMRQGIQEYVAALPVPITVTNFHEQIDASGNTLLFATGAGQIWKVDESGAGAHVNVFTFNDLTAKIFSFHAAKRLIFYNGVDRCVYTQNGTEFFELRSILEVGVAVSAAAGNDKTLQDDVVVNWTATDVSERDLVYYADVSAYGLITSVVTATITHTPVSGGAGGIGAGSLAAGATPVSGQRYAILDTVELNIIPVSGIGFQTDNTAVLASGSNASTVRIEQVPDFTTTEARTGDFVYNETRSEVSIITAITVTSMSVQAFTSAAAGDTVHLLKSSAPICKYGIAHFQRAYMIDARDDQKLRISGIGDPEDWGSINAGTYDISTQQPASERFKQLVSFQRFFIVGGTRHLFAFEGTDPIGVINADTGGFLLNPDWTDLGLFPSGTLSRTGMVNKGNELAWVTNNGVRFATLSKTTSQLTEEPASNQLDKTLRELLKLLPEDEIIAVHYPRRSWVLFKTGDEIHVYNYAQSSGDQTAFIGGQQVNIQVPPAWHLFVGPFAQEKAYFVRENGDMITGGAAGAINIFDQGAYGDLGVPIQILYESAWHGFEPKAQKSTRRKHGKYIKPVFEAPDGVQLTISVAAPYARDSLDSIAVSAATGGSSAIGSAIIGKWEIGGNDITFDKYPLRWNGEVAKFRFEAEAAQGPITLSSYTVFHSRFGVR